MNVTLSWSAESPHETLLIFIIRQQDCVVWRVALDLLAEELNGPAGLGDASLFPDLDDARRVELVLNSPSGRAGFTVARRVLREFLAKIQSASVELVNVDTEPGGASCPRP